MTNDYNVSQSFPIRQAGCSDFNTHGYVFFFSNWVSLNLCDNISSIGFAGKCVFSDPNSLNLGATLRQTTGHRQLSS